MEINNLTFAILLILTATYLRYADSNRVITPVKKLIIDTDAAGDDAVAIFLALEAERIDNGPKVVGITCVNGNTYVDNVALNVLKILKIVDRLDIPVYKGAVHPLLRYDRKDYYYGQDGFRDIHYPDIPSISLIREEHAVTALIRLVKDNPGDITLVSLGPLTNIALAISLYPLFLDELQQLIILGGSTEGLGIAKPSIEYNFLVDPIANFVVFSSSTSRPTTLIPYETTNKLYFSMDLTNWLNGTNGKILLIDSIDATFSDTEKYWYSTDTVAMIVAITSGSIVTNSTTYYSEAIYEGAKTAGMILIDYNNITLNVANTNIIHEVNKHIYKQLFLKYMQAT